jgi:hypothetical protein
LVLSQRRDYLWWHGPVFEERFGKESINTFKLVEMGNTLQFAREAVASVSDWRKISIPNQVYGELKIGRTWEQVGIDVTCVLNKLV